MDLMKERGTCPMFTKNRAFWGYLKERGLGHCALCPDPGASPLDQGVCGVIERVRVHSCKLIGVLSALFDVVMPLSTFLL